MAFSAHILGDTGPLVAFLRKRETAHAWAAGIFRELPTPFFTCEPVLAEALFLLAPEPDGVRRVFEFLAAGLLVVRFSILEEHKYLAKLVAKYQDLPMSLADACLVRMAELTPDATVLTLNRHFHTYRLHGRQRIPTLMPE